MIKNYCKICNKEITISKHQLCITCFNKSRIGNKHPRWNLNKIRNCIDCGKKISKNSKLGRCKSCAAKEYLKDKTHHPKWSGGKPHCQDCGKEITYTYIRCRNCELKRRIGKYHPCWQGGLSKLPYSEAFTERLKESIRKRDNYTCQLCHKTQTQQLKELNRKLSIHHIDYNKNNCKINNLTTLCHKCNSHVNKERNYWIKYFKTQK